MAENGQNPRGLREHSEKLLRTDSSRARKRLWERQKDGLDMVDETPDHRHSSTDPWKLAR